MTTEKVRVACLGAGKQSNWRHFPSLHTMADVEVVAVCDRNEDRALETAKRWDIVRTYTKFETMLEAEDPQAVYIIMAPDELQAPVTTALRQGRNVFVEKAPGVTLNQVQHFAYLAEQNNALSMVAFQRRFLPVMTEFKARVEARGPIHSVAVANLKSTRDLSQPASSGVLDQLTSDGMHAVDNLRWLCGGDVVDVASSVRTLNIPGGAANAVMAQVEFDSGAIGHLQYSFMTGGSALTEGATAAGIFRAEIHGTNISAVVDAERDSYIVADNGERETVASRTFNGGLGEGNPNNWLGFWHENRYFIDCVKAGVQPHCNFADAVKTFDLIGRIYASAGKPL